MYGGASPKLKYNRGETMRRIALVTGASRGIGLAVARSLAQAGDTVVLFGRHAEQLAKAAASLPATAQGQVGETSVLTL
jgi:NAD(P)-dependent dehydrogenase (short-subunit alcohol dehydrogenase family)